MGQAQNSNYLQSDKVRILKESGKLALALDKPIESYRPVDHHELDHDFDQHLQAVEQTAGAHHDGPSGEPLKDSPPRDDQPSVVKKEHVVRKGKK